MPAKIMLVKFLLPCMTEDAVPTGFVLDSIDPTSATFVYHQGVCGDIIDRDLVPRRRRLEGV